MDTGIFIALINPGMSLVFAAAFFLLWHHQRQRRYILVLGFAFLAVLLGFLLQYFTIHSVQTSRLVANLLFLAGGIGMVVGSFGRYDRPPPWRGILTAAAAGFAAFAWFLFVQPDLTARIYAINFTFGAITLVMAAALRLVPGRKRIDDLLLGLVLFWGSTYFIRPVAVIWLDGPYTSYDGFYESLYWITLIFANALFMVLFALNLVTAIATDMMEELRRESQTDSLSGLLNRRGFEDGAAAALADAGRKGLPATLVVCDLDNFKSINDGWGHACGDGVIASFAHCLRDGLDPGHVAGRVGGEEFAVLLHGADGRTGRLFAEGVRTACSMLSAPGLPEALRFSASFGVAQWEAGETVADLFARADAALYEAKKTGRNRVCSAGAPAPRGRAGPVLVDLATGAARRDGIGKPPLREMRRAAGSGGSRAG